MILIYYRKNQMWTLLA